MENHAINYGVLLICFFDRINISFAKFQLQADLSLSNTAYTWCQFVCNWVCNI